MKAIQYLGLKGLTLAMAAMLPFSAQALSVVTDVVGLGKHGDVKVSVTFEDNKILDIKVTRSKENKVLADSVYKDLKDRVIQTNSVDLDVISGATVTSPAFLKAIEDAVAKAGVMLGQADKSKLKKKIDALP